MKSLISIGIKVNSCISFQMFPFAKQSRLIPTGYKKKNLERKISNISAMRGNVLWMVEASEMGF